MNTDSFPVTALNRMDDPHERNGGHEVSRQHSHHVRVGATLGFLADDLRSSVLLEDIGELLDGREGLLASRVLGTMFSNMTALGATRGSSADFGLAASAFV